jgi:phosphinothricin acetyltransferase
MDFEIRMAQEKDLPALTDLYNYYIKNTAITFDLELYSVQQRREWFDHYNTNERHRLLVAVTQNEILGYASSSRFRPKEAYQTSVETSIYLLPDKTGKKVGTALYARLFEELAKADVHRAYAGITVPNPVSFAFHSKFGFQAIATYHEVGRKFGVYHDVRWLEKKLE